MLRHVKIMSLAAGIALFSLAGCEQQEFRMPPYIEQTGCDFKLVLGRDDDKIMSTSPADRNSSTTLAMGGYEVGINDCEVVSNPNGLAIYVDEG